MSRAPMTTRGAEKLRQDLTHLKTIERPMVIAAIAEARAHGDLKENAEYHAAKEQQGFIEGRISDIEQNLSGAQILDPSSLNAGGKVVFGATVELFNLNSEEEVTYQIVGDLEADIASNLVSISSPLARALIGKSEGDVGLVEAPAGNVEYEIVSVSYI
jgi:transcription elongation factor GreA